MGKEGVQPAEIVVVRATGETKSPAGACVCLFYPPGSQPASQPFQSAHPTRPYKMHKVLSGREECPRPALHEPPLTLFLRLAAAAAWRLWYHSLAKRLPIKRDRLGGEGGWRGGSVACVGSTARVSTHTDNTPSAHSRYKSQTGLSRGTYGTDASRQADRLASMHDPGWISLDSK